ncbi:MAG: beta-galactosidase [Agromyces sp.]
MTVASVIPTPEFPFGTHVYREPHKDFEQLLTDLPRLREFGFNMIKIQESWAIDEPADGVYDFSRIIALIEAARDNNLGVYLGLTMEQAPAWLWSKFPDAYMVDNTGAPHIDPTQYSMPADAKPGPNWNHPGARAAGERFMTELVTRLGAFDNVWVWNTFQEIGFWDNLKKNPEFVGYGYDEYTIAKYRTWLRERFGSIDALNEGWATNYTEFEHIDPPRRYSSSPAMITWQYYMYNVYLTEQLEWKTATIRAADAAKRPVFAHVGHPTVGSGQEWRWAAVGDFFGSSNYPAWDPFDARDDRFADREDTLVTAHYEIWHAMLFRNDLVRSATGRGRAMWGAEFQGGPISGFLHIGRTPSASDIRRWVLSGLASGMQGISFWNHRAEHFWHEGNGFGLMNRFEDTNERVEEVSSIAKAINADPLLFVESECQVAQVAIAIDENHYQFMSGSRTDAKELLQGSMRGNYLRLLELGISADFVEIGLASDAELAAYKAIILPLPLSMGSDQAQKLSRYVEAGGTLISEVAPGRHDEFGFATPTHMFDGGEELFGARQVGFTLVDEPGDRRWLPSPRGAGEIAPATVATGTDRYPDAKVQANLYLQRFAPTTGTPILLDRDEVVAVSNEFGNGRAVLLGTALGLSGVSHIHPPTDEFMGQLLADAGVVPDRVGALVRRRRVHEAGELWFLFNLTDVDVVESLDVAGGAARDLLGEALRESESGTTVDVPAMSVVCVVVTDGAA